MRTPNISPPVHPNNALVLAWLEAFIERSGRWIYTVDLLFLDLSFCFGSIRSQQRFDLLALFLRGTDLSASALENEKEMALRTSLAQACPFPQALEVRNPSPIAHCSRSTPNISPLVYTNNAPLL